MKIVYKDTRTVAFKTIAVGDIFLLMILCIGELRKCNLQLLETLTMLSI